VKISTRVVTPAIKFILSLICRIDAREMRSIPKTGPLIIVTNHVNFLEAPIVYSYLYPRYAVGLVKRETWDNTFLGALADVWNSIPIDRESTDLTAMRKALEALDRGAILILAPEGTRSGHGRLQKGHGGIIQLALRSGVPILPIAHSGGERFWENLRSFRRTSFTVRVGRPFRLVPPTASRSVPRSVREAMTEAVMNRVSILLPERQRGAYPNPGSASTGPIEFIDLD